LPVDKPAGYSYQVKADLSKRYSDRKIPQKRLKSPVQSAILTQIISARSLYLIALPRRVVHRCHNPIEEGYQMHLELTNRENQILKLIADGLTNREIACALLISESTVENHIHHIYEKLEISNRAKAVAYFLHSQAVPQNVT